MSAHTRPHSSRVVDGHAIDVTITTWTGDDRPAFDVYLADEEDGLLTFESLDNVPDDDEVRVLIARYIDDPSEAL